MEKEGFRDFGDLASPAFVIFARAPPVTQSVWLRANLRSSSPVFVLCVVIFLCFLSWVWSLGHKVVYGCFVFVLSWVWGLGLGYIVV